MAQLRVDLRARVLVLEMAKEMTYDLGLTYVTKRLSSTLPLWWGCSLGFSIIGVVPGRRVGLE